MGRQDLEIPRPAAANAAHRHRRHAAGDDGRDSMGPRPAELLVAQHSLSRGFPRHFALAESVAGRTRAGDPSAERAVRIRRTPRGPRFLPGQRRALYRAGRQHQLRAGRRVRLLDGNALLPAAAGELQGMPGDLETLSADRIQFAAAVDFGAHPVHAGNGRRGGLHAASGRRPLASGTSQCLASGLFAAAAPADDRRLPQSSRGAVLQPRQRGGHSRQGFEESGLALPR